MIRPQSLRGSAAKRPGGSSCHQVSTIFAAIIGGQVLLFAKEKSVKTNFSLNESYGEIDKSENIARNKT